MNKKNGLQNIPSWYKVNFFFKLIAKSNIVCRFLKLQNTWVFFIFSYFSLWTVCSLRIFSHEVHRSSNSIGEERTKEIYSVIFFPAVKGCWLVGGQYNLWCVSVRDCWPTGVRFPLILIIANIYWPTAGQNSLQPVGYKVPYMYSCRQWPITSTFNFSSQYVGFLTTPPSLLVKFTSK